MFSRVVLRTKYKGEEYQRERRGLVDWLLGLAKKLKLSTNTAQLGVTLLDLTMMKHEIAQADFRLYAATALLLAGTSTSP